MTLAATVAEAARRFGDRVALRTESGVELSYAALDRRSDAAALALRTRGVRPGDLVVLALPSDPSYVVAYAAAAKLGAATAGVNPSLAPPERAALVASVDARLVVATAQLAEGLPDDLAVTVVSSSDDREGADPDLRGLVEGSADPDEALEPLDPDPDRVVAVVFTSGTTGRARAAEFTEAQLGAITATDLGDRWDGGPAMLAATQFAHVGFMTKLPWYLRAGGTMHLLDRWTADGAIAAVAEHRIASIGGVAPQLALILRSPALDQHDLSCVRAIVMGGAASPPALVHEARQRLGAAYSIRYSSTESGGVGTATAFDAADDEALHTVGRARAGVEVQIRDEHGRPVPPGTAGEVCLRSGCVMRGYRNDPERTAATLRDGWLHTGDIGTLDAEGVLRLAGRQSEMYIRGGYNVHPQEVEAVLGSHPAVAEIAVVPRPDPVMGEVGVAVVVPAEQDRPVDLGDLRRFGERQLAKWKLPEHLDVVDALPLTAMAKLDRLSLREHQRRRAGRDAAS